MFVVVCLEICVCIFIRVFEFSFSAPGWRLVPYQVDPGLILPSFPFCYFYGGWGGVVGVVHFVHCSMYPPLYDFSFFFLL